jgi:hypothetical protein
MQQVSYVSLARTGIRRVRDGLLIDVPVSHDCNIAIVLKRFELLKAVLLKEFKIKRISAKDSVVVGIPGQFVMQIAPVA